MAYRNGETMRLGEVRDMNINPNAILDIGAHTGQFHNWAKRVWPDVGVFMVEANPLHESALDRLAMNHIQKVTLTTKSITFGIYHNWFKKLK